ncbi:hypothetical protein Asp14428_79560 [Actinoplanes sp. NBRC 14428]|uniref:Uncharacterized protein n=1 Tax=Pseudosporangium ferrugineum TaxID=439699 RepID=A0A2T0SJH7_9ACTN|nr:hypothetical protein [Pseudosporangium ferrugineum]PRY33569.1 hypothetical protein CLV70_101732 [Pseudosporangium ferrugineum]BCJ56481.1 hypothetical protein Asp14428_79560 [Actinoplanes sp. NBRC 14428]
MTAPFTGLLARADAELARLETAVAAVAANLVDLDDNSARKDLDKGPLTGATAAAWADATAALTQLWDGYGMLTALITSARATRGQRRLSDAERSAYIDQVLGRSITLSTATVPLAQRGLLGAGKVTTTCSPAELLSAMEAAFATAVDVATRAGDVWHRLMPAAADAAARIAHLRTLTGSPTLDEADRRLGDFTALLAADPLSCDERALDAVRTLADRADAERTSATELREALRQRLTDAHTLADRLAAAARTAAAAEESAAGRFPGPAVATVGGPDLRPDLAAIDALAAAGQWALISPRLAAWTRAARERLAALESAAARNSALLSTRNELRGRLDAYRAKAGSRGLAEDPVLAPLAERARDSLYTAPCDLEAARAAVAAYQEAVAASTREGRP